MQFHRCRQSLKIVCTATLALVPLLIAGDEFPEIRNSPSEDSLFPMPAVEAAAKMQLPNGFQATVFAAEPDVQNPIAIAWDEGLGNGFNTSRQRDQGETGPTSVGSPSGPRLWVAENFTYSDRKQRFDLSHRDRVLILEDLDRDGKADRRRVFLDNLQMLTSLEVGQGGVWLLCPPQLLFVPDADRDGIPDGPAKVALDGFEVAQDNYHNFANGLRWGPDGWLYGRCGHSCPGHLGLPGTPQEKRVPIDGGIWRFHPTRKVVEVLCHGTTNPWGHDWDQQGELFFINTVIGHLWHAVPGCHFKESFGESLNPLVFERMDMIADHYHFDTKGNWTDSRDGKANDLGGGHAHIGMMIYQGTLWPEAYRGKLMTINMHGRRANVERLERIGTGYVGRHEPDFFIAADPFFRGLELSMGPDEDVYVVDWSDTGECHEHSGVHRRSGRIFKVSYQAASPIPLRPIAKPWCLAGEGALPKLWRDYQLGNVSPTQLRALTRDGDEHVRAWAVRLLTDTWPLDWVTGPSPSADYVDDPETRSVLIRMAREDASGLVRRVLASTLQRMALSHRRELAMELVARSEDAGDRAMNLLVWYGISPLATSSPDQLVQVAQRSKWPHLIGSIARSTAAAPKQSSDLAKKRHAALNDLLHSSAQMTPESQTEVLSGLYAGLQGLRTCAKPTAWDDFAMLPGVTRRPEIVRDLHRLFGDGRALDEIRKIVFDKSAENRDRQQALQSLIDARPNDLREVCESLLDVRVVNATAARGLALSDDSSIAKLLVSKYRRFHPDDRPLVIELLVSRPSFARVLLAEVSQKNAGVTIVDIHASHARQIKSFADGTLSDQLAAVWGSLNESSADRLATIETWKTEMQPSVLEKGDLRSGRDLFGKTCAPCHKFHGEGLAVGPDLTGSQRSNLDYLLSNILDPSAVVSKDYRSSLVVTDDGRTLNGLVMRRDEQTLVLRTATDQISLPRSEVAEIKETGLSAMPDGLLQNFTKEQVRDLIAYLMAP